MKRPAGLFTWSITPAMKSLPALLPVRRTGTHRRHGTCRESMFPGPFCVLLMMAGLLVLSLDAVGQEPIAIVQDERIRECSGLACGCDHDNAVWMHNDSGDDPRLFLVDLDGTTRCVCHLRDATAVDWEDMCSFRLDDDPWLLIGDVGDNSARRSVTRSPCTLYLLKEPPVSDTPEQQVSWDVRIRFDYEDGPHNCEGVAVDAERREILLLTKESPLSTGVYRLPLETDDRRQQLTAKRIARLPMAFATGLDISPDGRLFVGITMWDGWICRRQPGQSWSDALTGTIHRVSLPQRRQGESVCFTVDGQHLLVNSEKKRQPLWKISVSDVLPDSR